MSTPAKKTKGRQKIEMRKILDEKSLAVTFSKRQAGIFNKLNELSTLCGVQFATIIFSPTKKPSSYGAPNFEAVVNRYLGPSISQDMERYENANIRQLNRDLTDMIGRTQAQKKTGRELDLIKKAMQGRNWRNAPIETLAAEQLTELKATMLELKTKAERLSMVEAATTSTPTTLGFGSSRADGAGPSK